MHIIFAHLQLGLSVRQSVHSEIRLQSGVRMTAKQMNFFPFPCSFEEELKKTPEIKMSDVEMLSEWYEKQQHLPKCPHLFLLFILHATYGSMERAKSTIENFFTIRSHVPEFFSNRDPLSSKELRQGFNCVFSAEIPTLSKQGYKVLVGSLADPDPSHYSFDASIKYFFMFSDLIGSKNGICDGYIFIMDTSNVSLGHLGRINPMGIKKSMLYVQEALPIRLKGIHFINAHPVMDTLINMMKSFTKKEFWNTMHVHSSLKTLEEYVSIDALPNEFGGKAGPVSKFQEESMRIIDDKREWFIEMEKAYEVDESLRIGKSVTANELFGVEGSFKKLDID